MRRIALVVLLGALALGAALVAACSAPSDPASTLVWDQGSWDENTWE